MKPTSTQSSAVQNSSTICLRRVMISGNFSSARPVLRVLVLCTIAANRRARSPLV